MREWFAVYDKNTGEIFVFASGDRTHIIPFVMEPNIKDAPNKKWANITAEMGKIDEKYLSINIQEVPTLLLNKLSKLKKIEISNESLIDA